MANNKQQTQMKAIAILIGIICLIVAMNKSMIVLFAVLITPILLLAYGGIYLMLIRNQKSNRKNEKTMSNNKQGTNNIEDLIKVTNTFKTYEQMYELLLNNDFSFLRREYGTMNYPEIEWMIKYFTEKEEYEKCNFLRNLELPKVIKEN